MTIFVDTGVFYAHHDNDAVRHDAARAMMSDILEGKYGQPYTNDYVIDETVTLTRKRTHDFDAALSIANRILGREEFPEVITVLHLSQAQFDDALAVFEKYADHDLSFTDATIVAACNRHGVDAVVSFDDDFDGLVDRIDPTNRS
jgi:predicted nucleic acid-binding protein